MSKHLNQHQYFQYEKHSHCNHKSKHKKHHHHNHNHHKHKHSLSESDYFRNNSSSHKDLIGKICITESRTKNCDRKNNDYNQDYYAHTNNFKKQKQISELQREIYSLNKRLTECETVLMKSHYEYQILRDTVQKMKIQNIERGVYDYQLRRQQKEKARQKQHQLLQQKYEELMHFHQSRTLLKDQYQKALNQQKDMNFRQQSYFDRSQSSDFSNKYYQTQRIHENKPNKELQKKNQLKNYHPESIKQNTETLKINKINRNTPMKQQKIKRRQLLKPQTETSLKNSEINQNKQSKQTTAHISSLKNNFKQPQIISSFIEKQVNQNELKQSSKSSKLSQKNKSQIRNESSLNQSKLKKSHQSSIRSNKIKKQTPYKLLKLQQQKKQEEANQIDQYFDIQTFKQIDQTLNDNQKDSNLLQSVQFVRTKKSIKAFQPFPSFKKQNSSAIQQKSNTSQNNPQIQQTVQNQYIQLQKVMQSLYQKLKYCSDQIQKQKLYQKITKVQGIIQQIKLKYNY